MCKENPVLETHKLDNVVLGFDAVEIEEVVSDVNVDDSKGMVEVTSLEELEEAPSSGSSLGSWNLEIRDWMIKKLNPDATSCALPENEEKAYFDKKLGIWVFPGDDPAELAKPIAPPPIIPAKTSEKESTPTPALAPSNDPLSQLIAPPPVKGLSTTRRPGASPRGMPSPGTFPGLPGVPAATPGGPSPPLEVPTENLDIVDGEEMGDWAAAAEAAAISNPEEAAAKESSSVAVVNSEKPGGAFENRIVDVEELLDEEDWANIETEESLPEEDWAAASAAAEMISEAFATAGESTTWRTQHSTDLDSRCIDFDW